MTTALAGIRVIEMEGIGPGPFCAMMLADMGAEVIRITRHTEHTAPDPMVSDRGRRIISVDLKKDGGADLVLGILEQADILIEGYRPGVMERLGLGPDICLARNPRLIYGRMTGWGQTGPLAQAAGHDLNYIAISGLLHAIGYQDRPPPPPLHVVGDLGGGGMMLAFGVLCALLETQRSGKGQVVDAAISDGAVCLGGMYRSLLESGGWRHQREGNFLDGGAHFYACYECKDGKYISVGAIEPQFYQELLDKCEIDDPDFLDQNDLAKWPDLKARMTALFRGRTRDQWCELLEGSDVCFAPVLDWQESTEHAHQRAREVFIKVDEHVQPAPVPRLQRTPGQAGPLSRPSAALSQSTLSHLGWSQQDIGRLKSEGVIR